MPILKGTNSTVSEVLKPASGDDRFGVGATSGHKVSDPLPYDRAECQVLEHETEPTVIPDALASYLSKLEVQSTRG